jgi:condensin-2 complex subunit D3
MECLRALLKDYKNEIDEILVADKQLQKELLYDMHKFEAGKGKSFQETAEAGPSGSSPGPGQGDVATKAMVRSVLKEMNRNLPTPPLHSMSVAKMKSVLGIGGLSVSRHPTAVLESVRRLEPFGSDDENQHMHT